ncbi:hypothetical protein NQ317_015619 [Molorchus minor]|uniref:Uncharacterized protein n=1 Tax=Molorchus minor TaxID=1323400 RepID=A0ABQ9JU26_9CUCU|nr:hypothetical protein NQ317_015619 [Molorchus minor]
MNYNAIPTIFPSLEGCSKDLPLDHTYCRPKLVNLEDEEVPLKKTRVLADILLNPGHESAVPTQSKSENLIMHELEPLNLSDEQDVNIIEVDNNTRSLQILSPSISTQTSTKLSFNTPRKRKYRENIRTLESENKGLKENVEKLEN